MWNKNFTSENNDSFVVFKQIIQSISHSLNQKLNKVEPMSSMKTLHPRLVHNFTENITFGELKVQSA